METFKDLAQVKCAYPELEFTIFRVVGGLGHQLFSLSEAYALHLYTRKKILLEYSDCEFLDSSGNAHSVEIAKKFEWAILVKVSDLKDIYIERNIVDINFPESHSYINEGFIADYNRVAKIGLFKPGIPPYHHKDSNFSSDFGAIHFRFSPLYKGNLGNINTYYIKSAVKQIEKNFDGSIIYVFSNDGDFAMRTLKNLFSNTSYELKFASHENPLSEIIQMSRAKFLIGSNSAMSWWGSYFGNNPSFFPKPFYLGYWNWEKQFFGPNMSQINQFKFMTLNRLKYSVLKYWRARGLVKLKILRIFKTYSSTSIM